MCIIVIVFVIVTPISWTKHNIQMNAIDMFVFFHSGAEQFCKINFQSSEMVNIGFFSRPVMI